MQRGKSTKTKRKPPPPPQPVELVLGSCQGSPPPYSFYRGIVVSLHPYQVSGQHASIVLGPLSSAVQGANKMEVRFQGTWAEDAIRRFVVGKPVGVQAEGGKWQSIKKSKGAQQAEQGVQWAETRLVFDQGVAGFMWNSDEEGDVVPFEFIGEWHDILDASSDTERLRSPLACPATARASASKTSAPAGQAPVKLPVFGAQQPLATSNNAPETLAAPSIPAPDVASTSRSVSPFAATTNNSTTPQPAPRPNHPSVVQLTDSTSLEPLQKRSDDSTRAEKEVLATSQEKVDESDRGKEKKIEENKRKNSQEFEGSRAQKKKKKLERRWELEVVS